MFKERLLISLKNFGIVLIYLLSIPLIVGFLIIISIFPIIAKIIACIIMVPIVLIATLILGLIIWYWIEWQFIEPLKTKST